MNKKYHIIIYLIAGFICFNPGNRVYSQSFKKGCLLISISEGSTTANYSTHAIDRPGMNNIYKSEVDGERDPLTIEFGLSNKWGIGLSSGTDIFKVTPNRYYGFRLPDNEKVQVKTSELTFDINYHYLLSKKLDLSAFSALGLFSMAYKGHVSDYVYNYQASGGILRLGTKARYYFYKRFGIIGMFSLYTATASPKNYKENNVGINTSTTISGRALEFGLCYRFF